LKFGEKCSRAEALHNKLGITGCERCRFVTRSRGSTETVDYTTEMKQIQTDMAKLLQEEVESHRAVEDFFKNRVAPRGPPQAMFDHFIIGYDVFLGRAQGKLRCGLNFFIQRYDVFLGRAQGPTLHYDEWLAIAKM